MTTNSPSLLSNKADIAISATVHSHKFRLILLLLLAAFQMLLSGCAVFPYKANSNDDQKNHPAINKQASFNLRHEPILNGIQKNDCSPKKHRNVLVLLAMSGGGSRAALFSGMSMLEMKNMKIGTDSDLLSEVDLISSVSGSSLTAAYYASSEDDNETCSNANSGRIWNRETVIELMGNNDYIGRWIRSWFLPTNIALYWLTPYDRSDIMSQVLADNLFDKKTNGIDLRFRDLNPKRPNLIINATQGSKGYGFGQPFTFTQEDFSGRICSSIDDYLLSRGVMASASFPGVFNFMTLENFCPHNNDKKYVHLFDGGNSDNLGLTSLKRAIWNLNSKNELKNYDKIIVISIDAATELSGVNPNKADPRGILDHIFDTNIIPATDSLLDKNRARLVNDFMTKNLFPFYISSDSPQLSPTLLSAKKDEISEACINFLSWKDLRTWAEEECNKTYWQKLDADVRDKLEFKHIQFRDIENVSLRMQLNKIATNFKLDEERDKSTGLTAKEAIICATPLLFGNDSLCEYQDESQQKKTTLYRAKPETKAGWDKLITHFFHTQQSAYQ